MLKVDVINGNLAVKLDTTLELERDATCVKCGSVLNLSLGYCESCVKQHLESFKSDLEYLLQDYPDVKLVPKGPNLIIRHKYGEEIYF
ncbi:MAG: hypothetical protein VR72_02880 [Clostridiaceae bacterium BRH_c20a]|nr:MAG: hypothetical protein VR72_02880 [Clostridiaceae bacterium BRH_c20a]